MKNKSGKRSKKMEEKYLNPLDTKYIPEIYIEGHEPSDTEDREESVVLGPSGRESGYRSWWDRDLVVV